MGQTKARITIMAPQLNSGPPVAQRIVNGGERLNSDGPLMKLLSHVRNDNSRLQDALVQARISLEKKEESSNIDFAHLLALVKEFSDDLGGVESVEAHQSGQGCEDFQVFAISSPRGSESGVDETQGDSSEDEVSRLKMELEQSRLEVRNLRAELASKDAELLNLRKGKA